MHASRNRIWSMKWKQIHENCGEKKKEREKETTTMKKTKIKFVLPKIKMREQEREFKIWRINKSNNNGKREHTKKGKYTNIVGCLVLSLRASKRCIVLEQHAVCMESVQWRQITNQFLIYILFLFFCWSIVCTIVVAHFSGFLSFASFSMLFLVIFR